MRAPVAPSTPPIRLHPDAAAVEVQALFRGVVIDTRCLGADPATYLIGSAKGVDAPAAEALAGLAHPLVSTDGRGFTVELTPEMQGTVIFEDRSAPLDELLRAHPQFVPPPSARLQIACGNVAFLIGATVPPATVPRPPVARWRDHWALAVAGAAALLLMLLVSFVPPDPMALSGDNVGKYVRTVSLPTIPPEPPPPVIAAGGIQGGGANGGDGKTAAPRGPRKPPATKRATSPWPTTRADIMNMGLLQLLNGPSGSAALDAALSADSALVRGNVDDLATTGDPGGIPGGIGLTGTGAGPGYGPLIGHGRLGTIGTCDAACRERFHIGELHADRLGPHHPRPMAFIPSDGTMVRGSLSKDIIRRIIRNHLNEVKYCYEQQLPRHPDLAGRLAVQFTIAPAGNVMASLLLNSTMNNVAVDRCVVDAIKRWSFPQPTGGGVVVVSYPFVLVPAGSS